MTDDAAVEAGALPPVKTLPDCMMPDGADPCIAYQELAAHDSALQAENVRLREALTAVDMWYTKRGAKPSSGLLSAVIDTVRTALGEPYG